MSIHSVKPAHEVAYQDLCALMQRHAAELTALELLAIAANMVGKLVAMQDQRTTTPEIAMETVAVNIKMGNEEVLEQLAQSEGTA